MSEVSLTLAADSLLSLPPGASYHAKSGRATLNVSKGEKTGTLVVTATCDSLERQVAYYGRLAAKYKASLEKQSTTSKEEKKPPETKWLAIAEITAGLLAGILITLKIRKEK